MLDLTINESNSISYETNVRKLPEFHVGEKDCQNFHIESKRSLGTDLHFDSR